MSTSSVLILVLFSAQILLSAMFALAASGHFPSKVREQSMRGARGTAILFGSIVLGIVSLAAAIAAAATWLPWYALVLGAGAAILFAPLALQRFPDAFVDGYGALATLSAGAAAAAALIGLVTAGSR